MAKKLYIGVDNTARKVKKAYVGVNNIARKIKKMYMGVNGTARCIFSGGELSRYGEVGAHSRYRYAVASIGNYAIFAGGRDDGYTDNVLTCDTSLVLGSASALQVARGYFAGGSNSKYAIFGGGCASSQISFNYVDAYTENLTKTTATALYGAVSELAAASVADHVLFAGGIYNTGDTSTSRKYVSAYDQSLTRKTLTNLDVARCRLAGANNSNYALFAGGYASSTNIVDAYDTSLTKVSSVSKLTNATSALAGTNLDEYILFGGGSGGAGIINIYDSSLTKLSDLNLGVAAYNLGAAGSENYAIFAGGYASSKNLDAVMVVDKSLTVTIGQSLSAARRELAGVKLGKYLLFGGGYPYNNSVIDAYLTE